GSLRRMKVAALVGPEPGLPRLGTPATACPPAPAQGPAGLMLCLTGVRVQIWEPRISERGQPRAPGTSTRRSMPENNPHPPPITQPAQPWLGNPKIPGPAVQGPRTPAAGSL